MAQSSLGITVWSKWIGGGIKEAHREISSLDDRVRKVNSSFLIASGRSSMLKTSMLALAPAVKTLGGVMAGTAAVGASMFVAAGVAAGVYGKVMSDTIKRTNEMRAAGEALSKDQQLYVIQVDRLRSAWDALLKTQEANTLGAASIAVDGMTHAVGQLNPMLNATSRIVKENAEAWRDWTMRDDGMKRFAENVTVYGVHSLGILSLAGREVLGGLGHLFREALVHSEGMAESILSGARAFNQWAAGGGFVRFFEWVARNRPLVDGFFDSLWAAVRRIGSAMSDMAPGMLTLVTSFLQLIANTPVPVLQGIYIALLGMKIVASVAAGIGMLTGALAFLLTPVGMVTGGILALAGGLLYLRAKTDFFETTWPAIWENVKKYAEPPLSWLVRTVEVLADTFSTAFSAIRDLINGDYQSALKEMGAHTDEHGTYVSDSWNALYAALKDDVFVPGLNALKEEWKIWSDGFKVDWKGMWSSLGQTLRDEESEWEREFASLWPTFKTTMAEEGQVVKDEWGTMWASVGQTLRDEESEWEREFSSLWPAIKATMAEEGGTLKADWVGMWSGFGTTLSEEGAGWKADWLGTWSSFRTTMLEEAEILRIDWNGMWEGIGQTLREEESEWETDWGNMWRAFGQTMTEEGALMSVEVDTLLSGLGTTFREEYSIWKDDWSGLWRGFTTTLSEEWDIITGTATTKSTETGTVLRDAEAHWSVDWANTWLAFKTEMGIGWELIRDDLGIFLPNTGQLLRDAEFLWKTDWTTMWTDFKRSLSEEWTIMRSDLGGFMSSIGSALSEEWGIWTSDWNGLWNGLKTTLTEELSIIKGEFSAGVTSIGEFWNGLKQKIAEPVQWVVDVVWNNGLRKAWNWINDLWGGDDLKEHTVNFSSGGGVTSGGGGQKAFRTGGPVRGPGSGTSDSINARLSNGEHVWTAREVQAAGGHGGVAQLRSAVLGGAAVRTMGTGPGFAEGGGFWDGVKDFFTPGKNMAQAAGRAAPSLAGFTAVADGLRNTINSASGFAATMTKGLGNKALDAVMAVVLDKLTPKRASHGGGGGSGHPGRLGWRRMWDIVRGAFPDATLTSHFRPGDPGLHGSGEAIDVGWPETSLGIHKMKRLSFWLADHYPTSTELIHTPGMNLRDGRPYVYNGRTADSHYNHVHWGMSGNPDTRPAASSAGADGWRGLILQELAHFGQYDGLAPLVHRRLMQESGGNARAINNWDINAKNGTPSKGLMQVIDPTFAAFKDTRWHPNDIWDPGANMHAAFAYALSRYGSLENAFNRPGGYALGTNGARSGWNWVGERGAELVKFRGGEKVLNPERLGRMAGFAKDDQRPLIDTGGAPLIDASGSTVEAVDKLNKDTLPKLNQMLKQLRGN